jgi:hypothetical protein
VIQAEILAHDNSWWKAPFLLDTGADRTVLSADVLTALRLPLYALLFPTLGMTPQKT